MQRRVYRHLETKELWEVRLAGDCLMLLNLKRGIRYVNAREFVKFEWITTL